MSFNHLILHHPLLLLPSIFPSIRVFSNELVLCIRGQGTGVSASASVLPMNILDWFPLGLTGLISLKSKGLSRVFSNTTVQKHNLHDPVQNENVVSCLDINQSPLSKGLLPQPMSDRWAQVECGGSLGTGAEMGKRPWGPKGWQRESGQEPVPGRQTGDETQKRWEAGLNITNCDSSVSSFSRKLFLPDVLPQNRVKPMFVTCLRWSYRLTLT